MDPYREKDINAEARLANLESDVEYLKKEIVGTKGTVLKGIRESLYDNFKDGAAWGYFASLITIVSLIFAVPLTVYSCSDTPEDIRARLETEQALRAGMEESCQAMNMHFIGWDVDSDILTCGNDSEIITIDINNQEMQTSSVHVQ